jgi:hypothetical protein
LNDSDLKQQLIYDPRRFNLGSNLDGEHRPNVNQLMIARASAWRHPFQPSFPVSAVYV